MVSPDKSREARPSADRIGVTSIGRVLIANPSDCLLTLSETSASLPVIGRHLEPLGGATAIGIWSARHLPTFARAAVKQVLTPGTAARRRLNRTRTNEALHAALCEVMPRRALAVTWPAPGRTPPLAQALLHRRRLHRTSVRYGDDPSQLLDVWRLKKLPAQPAPVLIFVPGGAWVHGARILQGYALMSHLADLGWVCLSIDYRVAPTHPWPQHITDVKTAIAWARAHVDEFGGDPGFVTISGASAGGHLAALAGLTANDVGFDASLPAGSDTSVDAVVGIYGRYDWEDRSTAERISFMDFLERVVVKKRTTNSPEVFRNASPIARAHRDAPPFFVIHGDGDTVIPVAQARAFVTALRDVSRSVVGYAELPGAGHGFDMTDGARTGATVTAIGLFLNRIHRDPLTTLARRVI